MRFIAFVKATPKYEAGAPPDPKTMEAMNKGQEDMMKAGVMRSTTSNDFQFDVAAARRLEAIYSTPDVIGQRREVLRALALRPAERVLDIGSGPGLLALEMAAAVERSGIVCGIDLSDSMIAVSEARCSEFPWVTFQKADAVRLPFPDARFDAAVSSQVYEYLGDVAPALAELCRVLRPGGRAVILDTDWDSIVWHSSDAARMRRVLAAWEEHLADPRLPRTLAPKLAQAGLRIERREVIPLFNPELHENTYSHGLIGLVGGFVIGRKGIRREEVEAWAGDLRQLGADGAYFFSLNRYLFVAVKPGAR